MVVYWAYTGLLVLVLLVWAIIALREDTPGVQPGTENHGNKGRGSRA